MVFRSPRGDACYYVFYDPNQNLFVGDPALPEELGRPYELPVNYRNTVRIAAHCALPAGYENRGLEGAPQGDEPVLVHARTHQDAFRKAGQHVLQRRQPSQGGLARSQVAVLVPTVSVRICTSITMSTSRVPACSGTSGGQVGIKYLGVKPPIK